MNNADLFWDRFEAIAWIINNTSACVDYVDKSDRLVFTKEDDFEYSQRYKNYVLTAESIDYELIYDFFCVAFEKAKLNYALEVGSDEAILDFLKHAYAKSGVIISDHDLNIDIEVIHQIMNEKQQALDCLKNAKTEAERKECVKNLPKNLRKEVLDKNSLEAYLAC
ncbi:hypothetical protein BD0053_13870 [Helicobacter pylori]